MAVRKDGIVSLRNADGREESHDRLPASKWIGIARKRRREEDWVFCFLGDFEPTERAGRCFRSIGPSALRNESESRRKGSGSGLRRKESADLS